jgi:hypothetical protein
VRDAIVVHLEFEHAAVNSDSCGDRADLQHDSTSFEGMLIVNNTDQDHWVYFHIR